MSLAVGDRLGPYLIEGPLGAGGMGEVYRARDTRLDRVVAIKVLSADVTADPSSRERFQREARTISSLEHPNICALYDVGEESGRAYLVMQYLEGVTLAALLARGELALEQRLRIAMEVCAALDAAHRHGIVHRDVKPANIMVTASGARLLDFGLAKQHAAVALPSGSASVNALTVEGTILGTLHYMAPEQIRGEVADQRSDLYSFGAVLYEMSAGRPPFEASDPASLIGAILTKRPAPLHAAEVPTTRLERAISICLEKSPDDRWQTARDLLRELQWIAEERGVVSRPVQQEQATSTSSAAGVGRRAWILGAISVLLAAAAGWAWGKRPVVAPIPPVPVVVLMDSPHPMRVYDAATRRAGGTNADDLTEVLGDLKLSLVKETTGTIWHRDDQILSQDPDLVLVHRSCFYDATLLGDPVLDSTHAGQIYPGAADKLESLLGYIALANARTRFVVYSRGSWDDQKESDAWIAQMERRFPRLAGRVIAYRVPRDRATFRDPRTAAEIKQLAVAQLAAMGRLPSR